MPGSFTDYVNDAILNLVFGATNFSPPSTLYVGLSQSTSNKSGALTEPTGGGYSRVALANTPANFSVVSTGSMTNANLINFPAPTSSWGCVSSLFIADSITGGNVLAMADLTAPTTIDGGAAAPTVAPGAIFLSHT